MRWTDVKGGWNERWRNWREGRLQNEWSSWRRNVWRVWKHDLICVAAVVVLCALTASLLWPMTRSFFHGFCRVEVDCRMKNVTVDDLKNLAKQEKEGMTGLSDLAGWRYGEMGEATDPATSRRAHTGVVYAYGTMSLVFPARVLDGAYGQAMGDRDCVVTEGLSYALFGAVDTCGNLVEFDGAAYRVAAVIDEDEEILILPTDEGRVELAAFLFEGRERVKERVEGVGF